MAAPLALSSVRLLNSLMATRLKMRPLGPLAGRALPNTIDMCRALPELKEAYRAFGTAEQG